VPKPIARWNPARDVWETQTTGLFCEHSDVWSETWPPSGMWDGGTVYALPTWEPRTDGSACSSLPTPQVSAVRASRSALTARQWCAPQLEQALEIARGELPREYRTWDEVPISLLPTPVADHSRGLPQPGTDYSSLPNAVMELLPTPSVSDGTGGHRNRSGDRKDELLLPGIVLTLLPTPVVTDATGTRNRTAGRSPNAKPHAVGTTLTDALCGASTNPRYAAGHTSSDDPPPHPPN
jgi:hypothetical protein